MKSSSSNSGGNGGHRNRSWRMSSDHNDSHQNHYSNNNKNTNNSHKNNRDNVVTSNNSGNSTNSSKVKSSNDSRLEMDPARPSISYWKIFFIDAGFTSQLAEEYSLIFAKHRIRSDMMNELNKEILSEMGIKAMGDIIAIVRQAKVQANLEEVGKGNPIVAPHRNKDNISKANNVNDKQQQQPERIGNDINNKYTTQRSNIVNQPSHRVNNTTTDRKICQSSPNQSIPKMRSRLSLNSGALKLSAVEKPHSHPSNIVHDDDPYNNDNNFKNSHNSNKRSSPSSKLSESLAKRLCPALPNTQLTRRLGEEKTLVVHYPSPSAIARARQRISSSNNTDPRRDVDITSAKVDLSSTSNIKSRLGQISLKSSRNRRR